jgi:histidinol-phosphatase (PHP family)
LLDLHVHLIGHRDRKAGRQEIRNFLDRACAIGLKEIGFADHDWLWRDLDLSLIREIAAEYPQLEVRVGLEVDYIPEQEEQIRARLNQFPFDYVIGSVHEIRGWPFDMDGEEERHRRYQPDELYRQYFEIVTRAAASGLFSVIGHLDLIKIFGVRPRSNILELAAPVLDEIERHDLVVEINTNGRYKPVGEFYPEPALIEEIKRRQIPFTLGSDAHEPGAVGRDLAEAAEMLRAVGVREVSGFKLGKRVKYPLDIA